MWRNSSLQRAALYVGQCHSTRHRSNRRRNTLILRRHRQQTDLLTDWPALVRSYSRLGSLHKQPGLFNQASWRQVNSHCVGFMKLYNRYELLNGWWSQLSRCCRQTFLPCEVVLDCSQDSQTLYVLAHLWKWYRMSYVGVRFIGVT